jgi:hypothetical protein
MTSIIRRETAKVYTFQPRIRAKSSFVERHADNVTELAVHRAPPVSYGNWYHEEAIKAAADTSVKQ